MADALLGPRRYRRTVPTGAEEAVVIEFRRRTPPPPGDVPGRPRGAIPARHGISRPPRDGEEASKRGRFVWTAIEHAHIDACGLRLAGGEFHVSLAIGRVARFARVGLFGTGVDTNGAAFLRETAEASPARSAPRRPTTAWPPPTCPATATGRRPGGWAKSPTASAAGTVPSTGRPSPAAPGPIAKRSG